MNFASVKWKSATRETVLQGTPIETKSLSKKWCTLNRAQTLHFVLVRKTTALIKTDNFVFIQNILIVRLYEYGKKKKSHGLLVKLTARCPNLYKKDKDLLHKLDDYLFGTNFTLVNCILTTNAIEYCFSRNRALAFTMTSKDLYNFSQRKIRFFCFLAFRHWTFTAWTFTSKCPFRSCIYTSWRYFFFNMFLNSC